MCHLHYCQMNAVVNRSGSANWRDLRSWRFRCPCCSVQHAPHDNCEARFATLRGGLHLRSSRKMFLYFIGLVLTVNQPVATAALQFFAGNLCIYVVELAKTSNDLLIAECKPTQENQSKRKHKKNCNHKNKTLSFKMTTSSFVFRSYCVRTRELEHTSSSRKVVPIK